ncbi:MAG: biopolymer transporter ExbD [Synergistaceae bacterium]|jgi:biopolymer transport protein ExbD|nr:biopolymer transporter ExbD [Synergistaceae bacterium]
MRDGRRRVADPDITPLIDVLFMLIIFFVLTAVFVRGAIEIELPRGGPPPVRDSNPIVVTVTEDSRILWAGGEVTRSELPELVRGARAKSDDILIAGDRNAPYGGVAELLDELRGLGVENVGMLLGEKDGGR